MHVTLVQVHVKREHLDAFVRATLQNHAGSRSEPGNLRFDVLQAEQEPERFVLVEVYRSAEDAAAHKRTPHYLEWREAVEGWMASPRQGLRYRVLAPEDPARW